MLHLAGWAIYVAADYMDHALFENYNAIPTLASGIAAYLLTGGLALLYDRMVRLGAIFQHVVFFTFLYAGAVVWHKVHRIFHYIVFHETETVPAELERLVHLPFREWIATGFTPVLLFLSWAGFFFVCRQYLARRDEQARLRRQELATKKAQLQTLRHQLNPHFLFNILNSIDVSVQSDDKTTAHKMTQHLSRFLRSSLEQGEADKIPLAQELGMLREFVAIEELRFQDKLRVSFYVETETEKALVPAMLFQPLMENAVKFAWTERAEGFVTFRATGGDGTIVVMVENSKATGGGRKGTGTGLKNIRERLEILYGEDASVTVDDTYARFAVTVTLPKELAL